MVLVDDEGIGEIGTVVPIWLSTSASMEHECLSRAREHISENSVKFHLKFHRGNPRPHPALSSRPGGGGCAGAY